MRRKYSTLYRFRLFRNISWKRKRCQYEISLWANKFNVSPNIKPLTFHDMYINKDTKHFPIDWRRMFDEKPNEKEPRELANGGCPEKAPTLNCQRYASSSHYSLYTAHCSLYNGHTSGLSESCSCQIFFSSALLTLLHFQCTHFTCGNKTSNEFSSWTGISQVGEPGWREIRWISELFDVDSSAMLNSPKNIKCCCWQNITW